VGGLVIDIYVEFLVRSIINLVRAHKSRDWLTVEASVLNSDVESGYGCTVAIVRYAYNLNDEPYTGTHKEPFISRRTAPDYLRRFGSDSGVVVRVKPNDHSESVLADVSADTRVRKTN
jgi:hypothetical protein